MTSAERRPILVVDDDPKIVRLLRTYLERAGHDVIEASDGTAALDSIATRDPALVVLDLMLPETDGLTVLEVLRGRRDTPVIILSARGTTDDRIQGLTSGADDYMPKPFSPAELVVRVARVLARTGAAASGLPASPVLERNGLVVDRSRHAVEVDLQAVPLTATELRLLVALLEADGRILTRDQLLDVVYGPESADVLDRTIDVLVGRVRDKLGDPATHPRFIETVRGVGYRATRRVRPLPDGSASSP